MRNSCCRGVFTVGRRILQKCSVERKVIDQSRSHWQLLRVNPQEISGSYLLDASSGTQGLDSSKVSRM